MTIPVGEAGAARVAAALVRLCARERGRVKCAREHARARARAHTHTHTPPVQVFGLHENADITKDLQESGLLLEGLLATQSRDSGGAGGGKSSEAIIGEVSATVCAQRHTLNHDSRSASTVAVRCFAGRRGHS